MAVVSGGVVVGDVYSGVVTTGQGVHVSVGVVVGGVHSGVVTSGQGVHVSGGVVIGHGVLLLGVKVASDSIEIGSNCTAALQFPLPAEFLALTCSCEEMHDEGYSKVNYGMSTPITSVQR